MPTYVVTDPRSGRSVTLTGDSPPTEAELHQIFARVNAGQFTGKATDDPIADILRTVQTSDRVRAAAWDAAYGSDDPDEVANRLRALPIGNSARAKLWDARFAPPQTPPEPKGLGTQLYEGAQALGGTLVGAVDAMGRALIPEAIGNAMGINQPTGQTEGMLGHTTGVTSGPVNAVNSLLSASWDELKAAKDAFDRGEHPATILRHAVGSTPMIGPALSEAGQDINEGNYGAGIGKSLGNAALLVGPKRLGNVAAGMIPEKAAAALEHGARSRVADVISPKSSTKMGRRMGNKAEAVAPQMAKELAAEGAPMTRTALHAGAREALDAAKQGLDAAADRRLAARSIQTAPVIDALQQKLSELTMQADEGSRIGNQFGTGGPIGENTIPGPNMARATVIQKAINELQRLGPTTVYGELKKMRKAYDSQAEVAYNPSFTADYLTQKSGALGAADVTGALRDDLARLDPDTAAANAQYSMRKSVADVLDATSEIERARPRVGRLIMARLAGSIIGAGYGPAAAVAGYAGGPLIESALSSGLTTKLKTAALMQRLADAVRRGDVASVNNLTTQMQSTVRRAASVGSRPASVGLGQAERQPSQPQLMPSH